jgi:ribonucleoside-diphosphate reductase alpha chain
MITAQEILVDNSSYPTEEIAQNARAYRELGLGYANLGALLMALAMPYDSEQGRSYAAAITALMTGEAYAQSARIAEAMGPFEGYPPNRDAMLKVIERHRGYAHKLDPAHVPLDLLRAARGLGRSTEARRPRRLSKLTSDRDRAHRHDRFHDGLRYHRHRT